MRRVNLLFEALTVLALSLAGCSSSGSGTSAGGSSGSSSGGAGGSSASGGTSAGGTGGSSASGGTSAGGTSAGGTSAGGTSAGGTSAGGSGGSAGSRCTNPVFTSPVGSQTLCNSSGNGNPNGQYNFSGGWDVYDNMWNCTPNCSGNNCEILGTEQLIACSTSSWYALSNQWSQGGAVMTYPAVQYNFNGGNGLPISNYSKMNSSFVEVAPHVGIYEMTYDIWINAIANPPTSTEVMIWVDNFHQTPAGSITASATLGGVTYDVWVAGPGKSYIAFVPKQPFTSGTVDLLGFFHWIMNKGWLPNSSTVNQIGFGPEIVSTQTPPTANNGHTAPFYVDYYTLDCTPACK